MDKSIFARERIHDTNMKVVIVRLDFAGVNDINELIRIFEKSGKVFKGKRVMENREINVSFRETDFKSISESLSIPIEVIKSERFVRYEGLDNCQCDVVLDISQFYLCLTIRCQKNYDGITNYVAPLKGAIKIFGEKVPYFKPKRLGIRKVRVEMKDEVSQLSKCYEPFVFMTPLYCISSPLIHKSEYFDVIEETDKSLRFNVRRELGLIMDKNNQKKYSTTLDIDAYYHEAALEKGKINDLITYANQREFEIYKECMTYSYLQSIYK